MMEVFNIILIILYFLIVLYIGFRARKKESDEGFLLANRNVGVFVLTATLVASMIGGNSIVSTMAFVYQYGISVLWAPIGTLLGFLVLALLVPKLKKLSEEHRFYTLPDFIHKKYGKTASIPTAFIVFLVYLGFLLIQFIAGGIILSSITGWSYVFSVVLMGVIVITYITAAGFKAVIRTDVFQYFIIFLLVILSISLFFNAGEIATENLNLFSAGPVNIAAFLLYGFIIIITGAEIWQRIYAGKNVRTVKKSLIWSGILTAAFLSIIVLMGLFVQTKFPSIVPETALAVGFSQLLPNYLIGIGLVMLFAAIMSSLDTFLFVLSTSVSKDFFGKFERFSHHKFVTNTRFYSVVLGIIAIVLALLLTSIISVLIAIAGIYFTLFASIIFSFKYNLKRRAVVLSIIGGVLASILAFIFMGITIESALVSFPASFILLGLGQIIFRKGVQ
jgi:SSS family solute:Na+ symporter